MQMADLMMVTTITVIISYFMMESLIKMLCAADKICRVVNYRGKAIPAIGGIVFLPVLLVAVLLLLLTGKGNSADYISYLLLALCMGFTGVIDDLVGDRKVKGIRNHIISAKNGVITTGLLKASCGLLASCVVTIGSTGTYTELIVNVLLITLFANTLNIFDLRPGRAAKVFLFTAGCLLLICGDRIIEAAPMVILSITVGIYIAYDLKEICMLGDTGANMLGITLGYYSTVFLGIHIKLLLLGFLAFLNIISEKISITEIIQNNRLLSFIDGIGRGQADNK